MSDFDRMINMLAKVPNRFKNEAISWDIVYFEEKFKIIQVGTDSDYHFSSFIFDEKGEFLGLEFDFEQVA